MWDWQADLNRGMWRPCGGHLRLGKTRRTATGYWWKGRKWEEEEGWYLVEENEAGLEDGNQLWSDDKIGAELTKVRLCRHLWQNGRILQWSNYVSTAIASLYLKLHPSSFLPLTTFSISIVENLEHRVGFGWRGGWSWWKKCDSVRADCKNFTLQEKVCMLIRIWLWKLNISRFELQS